MVYLKCMKYENLEQIFLVGTLLYFRGDDKMIKNT